MAAVDFAWLSDLCCLLVLVSGLCDGCFFLVICLWVAVACLRFTLFGFLICLIWVSSGCFVVSLMVLVFGCDFVVLGWRMPLCGCC